MANFDEQYKLLKELARAHKKGDKKAISFLKERLNQVTKNGRDKSKVFTGELTTTPKSV